MIDNIPKMSHAEKMQRAEEKAFTVCQFLASGEIYSTAEIIAQLLNIDRTRAVHCLKNLEKQEFLKSETHYFYGRHQKIYGIAPAGLALADMCDNPAFELGRTNPGWIPHRLDCQRMRLQALENGWSDWTSERILRLDKTLKKVPDAVALNAAGQRIAIEVERSIKTRKRYEQVIVLYLKTIKAGAYAQVHYVSPPGVDVLLKRTIESIKSVKLGSDIVQLTAAHFEKFKFFNFENWTKTAEQ